MRERFCDICHGWHDLAKPWPVECLPPRPKARSGLPRPYIVGDTIEPTKSMADGRVYTSKAALRATYLPNGNPSGDRYVEVGNDPSRLKPKAPPEPDRKGITEALERAQARYERGERAAS